MPSSPLPDLDKPAVLAALRARLGRLQQAGAARRNVSLCEAIDRDLPGGGLACAGVHEVLALDPGAAAGFCALLLARSGGAVIWIAAEPDAWPTGLSRFGLSPADLVLVRAAQPQDGFWAMEEALRCPGVAGALLATTELDMTSARRLQLAAEAGGGLGLLLRPNTAAAAGSPAEAAMRGPQANRQLASATLSRWRVGALASSGGGRHELGDPRWQLELLRCRGGQPRSWQVTWRPAADRLDLDEDPAQEAAPAQRRLGRGTRTGCRSLARAPG